MTYADTSALVKLLIHEAETPALKQHLADTPSRITSSELTIAELSRTVARAEAKTAAAQLLLQQIDLLSLNQSSLWRAGRLPSPAGSFLRTADAIHIIAALELGENEFLTYDRRQAGAAAELGFTIITPGRPADYF